MSDVKIEHLIEAQRLAKEGVLYAPVCFMTASITELKEVCNGCGAAGSWFRPPKTIYGTLIVYACIIHDWGYEFGTNELDKKEADDGFLNNMVRLIVRDSYKWYKPTQLQLARAKNYYASVKYLGGAAYWDKKKMILLN